MTVTRSELLSAAQTFCDAFAQKKDVETILSLFSVEFQPSAIEHGEASLAPFLGKPFVGLENIKIYFETIGSLLSYEDVKFSQFVVDAEGRKVACKGKGKFTWRSTKESWDETFAYMLDFDEEGKVTDYQVWADSGAAYLARIGKLNEARKEADNS